MERTDSNDVVLHRIIKRDGQVADLQLSAIDERIQSLTKRFRLFENTYDTDGNLHAPTTYVNEIFIDVVREISRAPAGVPITTVAIDQITYDVAEKRGFSCPDASRLAAIIKIDNLHRDLIKAGGLSLSSVATRACENYNPHTGERFSVLTDEYCSFVKEHAADLAAIANYNLDFEYPLDGCKVLEKQYLMKTYIRSGNGYKRVIIESPQDMLLRVAVHAYMKYDRPLERIRELYTYLSQKRITPATPILLRAGTNHASMASCFLGVILDSIEDIGERVKQAMEASKGGGGLAFRVDYLRANGAYIKRTNGLSAGPMPFIDIFNTVAKHVNQGGHRRASIAFYMSVWHMDIRAFVESRTEFGSGIVGLDIFTGTFIPDLFMRRLESGRDWTLFCPSVASKLVTLYGKDFDDHYEELERKFAGQACCTTVSTSELYEFIQKTKIVSGMPYILDVEAIVGMHNLVYTDEAYTSNLCTEVSLPTGESHSGIAVCNLTTVVSSSSMKYDSSRDTKTWPVARECPLFRDPTQELVMPQILSENHPEAVARMQEYRYIDGREGMSIDMLGIACSAYMAAQFLNRVIDINIYPNEAARKTCLRDRPIGVGQQGFADCLMMLGYGFDDAESRVVNRKIAATIYHFALLASIDYARKHGSVPSIEKTRLRMNGQLQPDIYMEYTGRTIAEFPFLDRRYAIEQSFRYGFANGVLTATQPTETSAKLNGSSEMWEPRKSIYYVIKNDKVNTTVLNLLAIQMLNASRLWTLSLMKHIRLHGGSVADYTALPSNIRAMLKSIYEYDQFMLLDYVIDREPYISMTQSANLYLIDSVVQNVAELDIYGWQHKLRTRSYYVRVVPSATFRPELVLDGDAATAIGNTEIASCTMCQ